jgi:hypothetical protein
VADGAAAHVPAHAPRRHARARGARVTRCRRRAGIDPRADDEAQATLLAGCDADLVFGGHTHRPVDRMLGPVRAINLGSVSNPVAPDLRASYVILDAGRDRYRVEHRRVAYDCDAVIAELERLNHPGRAWLISHHRGEID